MTPLTPPPLRYIPHLLTTSDSLKKELVNPVSLSLSLYIILSFYHSVYLYYNPVTLKS